jgi:hypothetical protein
MKDHGTVAEERSQTGKSRSVIIGVGDLEGIRGNVAMLSRQIADLASLWQSWVARRRLEGRLVSVARRK